MIDGIELATFHDVQQVVIFDNEDASRFKQPLKTANEASQHRNVGKYIRGSHDFRVTVCTDNVARRFLVEERLYRFDTVRLGDTSDVGRLDAEHAKTAPF